MRYLGIVVAGLGLTLAVLLGISGAANVDRPRGSARRFAGFVMAVILGGLAVQFVTIFWLQHAGRW